MTVTEAPTPAPTQTAPAARRELHGLPAVLGTGDHKTIGRIWVGASALFLVTTVVVGVLVGFERVTLDEFEVVGSGNVLQLLSLHQVGLALLVVVPLFLGLATAVVPLQVGAASIAFPRAAAAALWTWLGGALLLCLGYALDGGPGGGDADAVALWLLGLGLIAAGILLASLCVVTTAFALRTPHMSLLQVPPFAWSMVVAGVIWLVSLPVLLAGILLAYLDLRYGQFQFGAADELFNRLAWVLAQPQVYALAIPVLGIVAEIVPPLTGVVQRGRQVVWGSVAAFGVLAFGAWAQPAFRPELTEEFLYVAMAFAIVLPVLALAGAVSDCVARGKLSLVAPLVLADLALLLVLLAVVAGAIGVIEPLSLLGTTWVEGHFMLVVGAALVAGVAALVWWAPKVWGAHVPGGLGLGAGLLVGLGALVVALSLGLTGLLDVPAAWAAGVADVRDGVEALHVVAAIGSVVLALGALLLVVGLLQVLAAKAPADDAVDPWGGQTLEWSAPSPPPVGNFPEPVAEVTSATPLVTEEG